MRGFTVKENSIWVIDQGHTKQFPKCNVKLYKVDGNEQEKKNMDRYTEKEGNIENEEGNVVKIQDKDKIRS